MSRFENHDSAEARIRVRRDASGQVDALVASTGGKRVVLTGPELEAYKAEKRAEWEAERRRSGV